MASLRLFFATVSAASLLVAACDNRPIAIGVGLGGDAGVTSLGTGGTGGASVGSGGSTGGSTSAPGDAGQEAG